ncbi:MAG TPA: hypothetical protein VD927_15105 [Chryseosolibacter sp.]|nr:hypothetical protein [Chryseosolibacter sp.]
MKINFKDIKPLVADATIVGTRILCQFKDQKTGQVVLSGADLPNDVSIIEEEKPGLISKFTSIALFGKKDNSLSVVKENAIVEAFHKVNHQFENRNGRWQIRETFQPVK